LQLPCESINSFKKDWKLVNFCEFDKYATKSYCAIHGVDESLNLGDITKVDETNLEQFNMICGGSPCQDFSVAGKQKGSVWTCKECGHEYNPLTVHWAERDKCPNCNSENIEKTRSSLLVEYLRVIRANKPNFGIYENVKNIVGRQFKDTTFKLFTDELEEYGYNVYWKVLNAKNYGIPQNRERVYLIFIKKDLDNGKFKFPEPFDNGVRLKDLLEDVVDQKYYLSKEVQDRFKLTDDTFTKNIIGTTKPEFRTIGQRDLVYQKDSVMGALVAIDYKQPKQILDNDIKTVAIPQATKKGYIECEIGGVADLSYPDSKTRRGRVQDGGNICPTLTATETGVCRIESVEDKPKERFFRQALDTFDDSDAEYGDTIDAFNKRVNKSGCSPTLTTRPEGFKTAILPVTNNLRVRKLTPKECFRLMGFSDENFNAAHNAGISNSQLYKQAGNSIVVDVLYYIFVELYKAMPYLFDDLKLSSFFSGIGAFEVALDRLYKGINFGNFTNSH
jgi:DNA (cytosine-5)-methyltransferase 1